MQLNKLNFIYNGGKTKRFHTADTLTSQTVGEHSFGVAWLCHLIYPKASKNLILAALAHDLAEHVVGDVSSPFKKAYPGVASALNELEISLLDEFELKFQLAEEEKLILKLADLIDGMMWAVRERRMGSLVAVEIYNNFRKYFWDLVKVEEYLTYEARTIVNVDINKLWREVNERE